MGKIVLVGYMGAGKSHVGALLSEKMNLKFLDLDDLIEKSEGKSIKNIFSEHGEIYFRKVESKIFNTVLASNDDFVLSVGGGTPCYANNHLLLNSENVFSVYLKASVTTLKDRLIKGKTKRPLIADLDEIELEEYIAKHLFDRNYYYHQCTKIISVDAKTPAEIAQEIMTVYSK
ncbi:shikimate kinase [Flavobacterium sp.]|uniref:shikimate kinase n=1 Tax=Flavobacterium sp. TaxID=239 RepID=UPI003D0D4D3A